LTHPALQLEYGYAQAAAHAPPVHTWPALHAVPQVPQFAASFRRFEQRAAAPVPHCTNGFVQADWQVPWLHSGVEPLQTLPQAPQLFGSPRTFTQLDPHWVRPVAQLTVTHAPETQAWPPAQAVPHLPQFAGSYCTFEHTAVEPLPHRVSPVEQDVEHTPALHTWPAEHFVPQAPQFCGSVWKFVQIAVAPAPQALGALDEQAHLLAEQDCSAGHTVPQAPQLLASVVSVAQ